MKAPILTITIVVVMALIQSGCREKNTRLTEESITGKWYTIKGDLDSYSFLKDGKSNIFVGTLGMRPVIYGTWKADTEVFSITMDNGTTTEYSYTISNDTLTFNEGLEIYTRTEPLEVKYPEVRILTNISSSFSNLNFSAPQITYLAWGYWNDSTNSIKDFILNGYSVSAESTISSGYIKEISDYIKDYGFESDTLFLSEMCDGYRDVNQIVTLCTINDKETSDDSITIRVSSALIVK